MVATPVGWVGLVLGGLVGAGAAVSVGTNDLINNNAGKVYDLIMKEINAL